MRSMRYGKKVYNGDEKMQIWRLQKSLTFVTIDHSDGLAAQEEAMYGWQSACDDLDTFYVALHYCLTFYDCLVSQ